MARSASRAARPRCAARRRDPGASAAESPRAPGRPAAPLSSRSRRPSAPSVATGFSTTIPRLPGEHVAKVCAVLGIRRRDEHDVPAGSATPRAPAGSAGSSTGAPRRRPARGAGRRSLRDGGRATPTAWARLSTCGECRSSNPCAIRPAPRIPTTSRSLSAPSASSPPGIASRAPGARESSAHVGGRIVRVGRREILVEPPDQVVVFRKSSVTRSSSAPAHAACRMNRGRQRSPLSGR